MFTGGFLKLYIGLYLMHNCIAFKLDDAHISQWVAKFQGVLETHVQDMLAYPQLQDMLRKYEGDLLIGRIDGGNEFEELYTTVTIKYSDVMFAVKNLKASLETPVGQPPSLLAPGPGPLPAIPGRPMSMCCGGGRRVYTGRFRQEVALYECYDHVDDELKALATENFTRILRSNYQKYPVVTWQYFADDAGHFIQYPASDRLCDTTMPAIKSPLTQQWFVEKLRMERKNLVILFGMGKSTDSMAGPGTPRTRRDIIIDAVQQTLGTLTPNDKINLVSFPSASGRVAVPPNCNGRLMIASQRNVAYLREFADTIHASTDEPDLVAGMEQVYTLLKAERTHSPSTFEQRSNIVLLLLDDRSYPTGINNTQLLEHVAVDQHDLGNSVQHFVYVLGNTTAAGLTDILAQIADQNNGKLNKSSGIPAKPWPPGVAGSPVGREGAMEIVTDATDFPEAVSGYFRHLPPKIDEAINLIMPVLDRREAVSRNSRNIRVTTTPAGVALTLAAPVYDKVKDAVVGVVAVDSTLARVFTDVTGFDVGEKSYAFLMDVAHGHVLLHPKLRDPAESYYDDTVFPELRAVEPELNATEISQLLNASTTTMRSFNTEVRETTPLMEGELLADIGANKRVIPATIYYQRLHATNLCLALVHYHSDVEEAKGQFTTVKEPLHAPYHRIDKLMTASSVTHKPDPNNVCELQGNYVSFKESVVKLSPPVFTDTEGYKYRPESLEDIKEVNSFIINETDTELIKKEYKSLIQHSVKATNQLDTIWTSHAKEVIERFYGSPFGVFRLYPGTPLENTFDHMKTEWYKRSITMPNTTVYHSGKLNSLNRKDVIIVTKALVENSRLQGVTGMKITPRFLTSQLINTVTECTGSDIQCHILDSSGQIMDSLVAVKDRHVSQVYPGLTAHLIQNSAMKIDWCTAFSDGYHKALFSLVSPSSDVANINLCLQYSIRSVPNTNMFILVMVSRKKLICDNFKTCSSCENPTYNPQYHLRMSTCEHCLSNTTDQCQCPCFCDSDFDQCDGQYDHRQSLPVDDCFYPPFHDSEKFFKPDYPGPDTAHCPLPCVAISDMDVCPGLKHCKLSSGDYPTCIWKDENELNNTYSYFFPTTTPRPPPTPPGLRTQSKTTPNLPNTPPKTGNANTKNTSTTIAAPPALLTKHTPSGQGATPTTVGIHSPTSKVETIPLARSSNPRVPTTGVPTTTPVATTRVPTTPSLAATSTAHHVKGHGEHQSGDDGGMSKGAIAALSIGLIALACIVVFVVLKVKGKKFRRPGADGSSDRYVSRSLFDSSVFNRSQDSVTIATAPTTTIPYHEM